MIRLVLFVAAFAFCAPARADCDHLKWSVAQERSWFAGSPAPLPATGGQADVGKGYALTLTKNAKLPVAPERAPVKDRYAGVLEAPKLDAGLYQVTLSEDAWIDVAQNGAIVRSSAFSGQHDCPGVRKSVRFQLGAGAATVEISNATVETLNVAIAPAK